MAFDQGVALQKKESSDWGKCLFQYNELPCNAIVVVDNYILNDVNIIEENLRKIFDSLIPKRLNEILPFQVTIFTTLSNDSGCPFNSSSRLEKINNILGELRPNFTFEVSIIKCSKDKFHDRTIITNNLYVSCGGGFGLFKNGKSQKTTTVSAFNPYFNTHTKWTMRAYSNAIIDAKSVFNNTTEFNDNMNDSFPSFAIGNKRNRILET